jgi:hypothetical protein
MTQEALVVFTAKSVEAILEVGGTQSWKLDRGHAKRCHYAILCRNAYTDWGDGKEPHGTAFMIGRIADVVPTAENDGRWLVTFDEYARIDLPNVWKGWRNPVRYSTLEELGVSLEGIQFQPMPPIDDNEKVKHDPLSHPENGSEFHLTIAEAKQGLAKTFGVAPDAIEITIRG